MRRKTKLSKYRSRRKPEQGTFKYTHVERKDIQKFKCHSTMEVLVVEVLNTANGLVLVRLLSVIPKVEVLQVGHWDVIRIAEPSE